VEVVRDAAAVRAFWKPRYAEWFPTGVEDPDLALLEIEISRAEYWDSPGLLGMVGKMFEGFLGAVPAAEEATEKLHRTVKL
jgi:general stress protein 26